MKLTLAALYGAFTASLWWAGSSLEIDVDFRKGLLSAAAVFSVVAVIAMCALASEE